MEANCCIDELMKQLEEERSSVRREKLAVARLQREIARSRSEGTMREKLILQLEEERRLRLESEKRLREVTEEAELGRAQAASLQQQFSRMEETVRSLLQSQAVEAVDIMKVYKDKLSQEQQQQEEEVKQPDDGPGEKVPDLEEEDGDKTKELLECLKALEEKNSALALENKTQREQYERCLDEVANQVVQALLTQKDLREECLKLRTRVFDLEQQNRALSVLFQQKIKPASDLLLQKLHSRILDLSAADLLLEPERSKAFLLSRSSDWPASLEPSWRPSSDRKCLSQLSLASPPTYPRSSCSSSELSLSSACSDFSSGSYTWNDGRSSGKPASLTWEKRLSLGSSAPGNICGPPEEQQQQQQQQQQQPPTRRKESHILEGLRKLQRRKQRSSSASSRVYKDCMNSNEGIYSLGLKSATKGTTAATRGRSNNKLGLYDSDDADDELVQGSAAGEQDVPTRDGWCSSLCSWAGPADSGSAPLAPLPPPKDDGPEELLSFINSFLPEGGRTSAFRKPSKLTSDPPNPDREAREEEEPHPDIQSEPASRQWLQARTQSADSRPRPLSLVRAVGEERCSQSEESILAMLYVEAEPAELQEMVPGDRPTRQRAGIRDSAPSALEAPPRTPAVAPAGTPRRRLTRPLSSRGTGEPAARSAPSRIPASARPLAQPPRTSRGSSSDPPQDRSPCSPPATAITSRTSRAASWRSPAGPHPTPQGEQPTKNQHCDATAAAKGKLRSPSPPPPPPGRSTSLLVKPHQQLRAPPPGPPGRAPPPSYHTSLLPSLQATLPIRDKEPPRTNQQPHRSPAAGAAAKGGARRSTKSVYAAPPPPSPPPDTAHTPTRTPKNVPPPYSALRCSASAFTAKRGPANQDPAPPPMPGGPTPNTPERAGKSRIPMGFKAFLKAPPTCRSGAAPPGKQEKDHFNSVSRESVTFDPCGPQGLSTSATARTTGGRDQEEGEGPEEGGGAQLSSQMFCRPAHPKPVLGLTGAKARSQSFSSTPHPHQHHQPPPPAGEGSQVRTRTHIITTSGERGGAGSLTRHSSLEVPAPTSSTGPNHSPNHSPRTRLSHYGGMTAPSAGHGGLSNLVHKAKVSTHPFQATPPTSSHTPPHQSADGQLDGSPEVNPSARSIEEKVMLGIKENVQKKQENQEKVALGEARTRTRTAPSLANWFGLRRSKLPALGGKKAAEASRPKEEKKEEQKTSPVGVKTDRRKEKEKNQEALLEVNNKLSSIMDHCNNHMGHIANHIHTSTAFMGKEQLVRELLGRATVKSSCVSPPAMPAARKHCEMKEMCCDTATLIMGQKIQLRDGEEVPDSSCQDHMMGCQTRTLDSGIGTFPLPDSHHAPRPEAVSSPSTSPSHPDPDSPQPHVKVPSPPPVSCPQPRPTIGHSHSEPSVTGSQQAPPTATCPESFSQPPDAIRTKRWSLALSRSGAEDQHQHKVPEKKKKKTQAKELESLCTYSGSSSSNSSDTEAEAPPMASPPPPLLHRKLMMMSRSLSAEDERDTLKRQSREATPSIMELYQQDVAEGTLSKEMVAVAGRDFSAGC
ncbi:nck-associated protein 5-like isoform X3 [Nelusetta ayraudi]